MSLSCNALLHTRCSMPCNDDGGGDDDDDDDDDDDVHCCTHMQVVSRGYEVLLVSQFTLYGRLKKPRPDFSKAMPPAQVRLHLLT
jgi:hypothetical protein